jgi:L-ribulose-5-phosphate 3-epimerase
MRLSVITDEIGEDLRYALDVCDQLRVATVELRSVDGMNIVNHSAESLDATRRLLSERRISVCAIASPFLKCPAHDPEPDHQALHRARASDEAEQWHIFERSVHVAQLLGAPLIRTFSFWRIAEPRTVFAYLTSVLRRAGRMAAGHGLRLVLENEYDCNIATSGEAAAVLEALDPEELGLIWDPANAARFRPSLFDGLGGYESIRGRVAHVHLKDVDGEGSWVRIGSGIVDHGALLSALKADGYSRCLSVETHYDVGGSREAATRECVASLRALGAAADVDLS